MYLQAGGASLLREHAGRLLANLPRAIQGEEEPVHQVRVASRRMRVFLPILAFEPDGKSVKRLRKGLRDLVRNAGASRDLDICLGLFDKHLEMTAAGELEIRTLRRRLVAARARSRRTMAVDLHAVNPGKLRRAVKGILRKGTEDLFVAMARFRRARDENGSKLLDAMTAAGDAFQPEMLHEVRKKARRMRYLAELGAAFRGDMKEAPFMFKKIQDELGRIQDAHVLAVRLESIGASAERRGEEAMAALAREISRGYMDLSRSLHHGYLLGNPLEEARGALRILGHRRSAA